MAPRRGAQLRTAAARGRRGSAPSARARCDSCDGAVEKAGTRAAFAGEHGIEGDVLDTTPICIERVVRTGSAVEHMPRKRTRERPFFAGIGLRVDPAPIGSGLEFRYEI